MFGQVWVRRYGGRQYAWIRQPPPIVGSVTTTSSESGDGYRVPVLHLSPAKADGLSASLHEPRIRNIDGNDITLIGFERAESSWVMQEWKWELNPMPRVCCYCNRELPVTPIVQRQEA